MFTHRVLDYQAVVTLIQTAIKEWVTWERANSPGIKAIAADEQPTSSRRAHDLADAVKTLVDHLVVFDRYTQVFETCYLASTEAFYTKEAAEYAAALKNDVARYNLIADTRIAEEEERCRAVTKGETLGLISNACLVAFLEKERLAWLTTESKSPAVLRGRCRSCIVQRSRPSCPVRMKRAYSSYTTRSV
jgi:hypothetical protein